MTIYIVISLTAADAAFPVDGAGSRRRITSPEHALEPMPLASGSEFILPASVVDSPDHAASIAEIAVATGVDLRDPALQRDVAPVEFRRFATGFGAQSLAT